MVKSYPGCGSAERNKDGKTKGISEEVRSGDMPINSYTMIHTYARLTEHEKKLVSSWANTLALKKKYLNSYKPWLLRRPLYLKSNRISHQLTI